MIMGIMVLIRMTFGAQRGLMVVVKGMNEYCDEGGGQDNNKDEKSRSQ